MDHIQIALLQILEIIASANELMTAQAVQNTLPVVIVVSKRDSTPVYWQPPSLKAHVSSTRQRSTNHRSVSTLQPPNLFLRELNPLAFTHDQIPPEIPCKQDRYRCPVSKSRVAQYP